MQWPELDYFLRWKEFSVGTTGSQLRLADEPSAQTMSAANSMFIETLKRGGKYQVWPPKTKNILHLGKTDLIMDHSFVYLNKM